MTPTLIIAAIDGALAILSYFTTARADLAQNAEWTAEQRAAVDAKIASIPTLPHWQPND
jgi:hypothetical protein